MSHYYYHKYLHRLIFVVVLFLFNDIHAQNRNSLNRQAITVNYSNLHFLNKQDVKTIEGSKKNLTANNTNGFMLGVGYEYTSPCKVMFSVNTLYGIQKHSLQWKFTFDNPDSNDDLRNFYSTHEFNAKNQYVCNVFMIGYVIPVTKKYKLLPKAGIGIMHRFGEQKEELAHILVYSENNTTIAKQYALTDANAGAWGNGWNDRTKYYSVSINFVYAKRILLAKELGIGIDYNKAFVSKKNPGINDSRSIYYSLSGDIDGIQVYYNKFRSIGLNIKIGF